MVLHVGERPLPSFVSPPPFTRTPLLNLPIKLEALVSKEADGVLQAGEEEEIQEVDETQHSEVLYICTQTGQESFTQAFHIVAHLKVMKLHN